MARFIMRRVALLVVAVAAMSGIVFVMLRILPGDVASAMAGVHASPGRVGALRRQFGLDQPLATQYVDWMTGLMCGDFGLSVTTGRSVSALVGARASVTLPLIAIGLAVALAIGLPLGCAAALSRSPRRRGVYQAIAIVGGSVPALWAGALFMILLGRGVGLIDLFPSQGFGGEGWAAPRQALASLMLPALTVGVIVSAGVMRYTRSALDDLAPSGYIDMAMACGMTRREAMLSTGLRLSAPRLVSVLGLTLAQMITGVMVVENLFALPGLGTGLVVDVGNRDLVAVQGELFMLTVVFLVIGFLVDIMHRVLDPRLGDDREERR
ncbi:ABC transporter permease [Bifidobacterium mongoliense]|uniref:ABC transporter, permease protein n=1 Tax=Bifidobacterium mongoliense DSM 21395 TaxID=1437603 RepID=A0A087BSF1_9BIFI|nr:ABC transporter permease [Bifidobacterium mongoliense]KFI73951.1 ABC transporter, permease protein [Bifidobacterium mongoliense DSM 21395]